MHYPKVLERVGSPEQIFHRRFSLGAPDIFSLWSQISVVQLYFGVFVYEKAVLRDANLVCDCYPAAGKCFQNTPYPAVS